MIAISNKWDRGKNGGDLNIYYLKEEFAFPFSICSRIFLFKPT